VEAIVLRDVRGGHEGLMDGIAHAAQVLWRLSAAEIDFDERHGEGILTA
jgi:hypothetical protein